MKRSMGHDEETLAIMNQCFKVRRVHKFRGFDGNGNWVRQQDPENFAVYTFGDHFLLIYPNGNLDLIYNGDDVYTYRQ